MDFPTAMRGMEADPKFAALPYDDQLRVRAKVASGYLLNDQKFLQLQPQDQGKVMERIVRTPPVYEQPDKFIPQTKDFIEGINQDRQDVKDAIANKRWWVMTNPEGITLKEAGYKGGVMFHKWLDELSLAKGAASVIQNGALSLLGLLPFFDGEKAKTELAAENRDRKKFVSYVDYYLSQDKRMAGNLEIGKSISSLAGVVTDIAMFEKILGTKNPGGTIGRVINSVKGLDKVVPFLRPWMAKGLSKGVEWGVSGMIGVVRENLKNVMNGASNTPEGAVTLHNSMRYFSEYALGDIALFSFMKGFKNVGKGLSYIVAASHEKPTIVSDIAESLYYAMSNQGIPVETMGRLPDPIKKIMRYDEALFSTLKNVERMDDVDRFKVIAGNYGYMVDTEGGALNLTHKLDDEFKVSFNDMDKAQDWFAKQVIGHVESPVSTLKLPTDNPLKTQLRIREVITKSGSKGIPESAETLSQIVAPVEGNFSQNGVKGFVEGYLASKGAPGSAVITPLESSFKVSVKGVEFEVPKKVLTGKEEQAALEGIINSLQGIEGGKVNPELTKKVMDNYLSVVGKKRLYTPGWVEQAAEEVGVGFKSEKGQFIVTHPDGKSLPFNSYHDAADEIVKLSTDELTLKKTLAQEHGLVLEGNADKGYELRQVKAGDAALVETFPTLNEFYSKYPHLIPGIDSKLGPQFTVADDGLTEMRYFGKVLTGDRDRILSELKRFRQADSILNKVKIEEGVVLDRVNRSYEVSAPGMGMKQEFRTLSEAKGFLRKMEDPYEKMIEQSYRKGYRIHSDKMGYFFYDSKGNKFSAKTVKEVNTLLEKVPVPEYAPELVGFDAALRSVTQKLPTPFSPQAPEFKKMKTPSHVTWKWMADNFYRMPEIQFHNAVKRGASPEFYNLYKDMESALSLAQGKDYEFQKIINNIFVDPITRKGIKGKVREQLGAIYERGVGKWEEGLKEANLPAHYIDTMKNVKTFYDNWYTYIGVKEPFLEKYLPIIKNYFANPTNKVLPDGEMSKQLQIILGTKSVPQDLDAFFSHARVSDVHDYVLESDPLEMLRKTTTLGVKQKFVGPIWKDMRQFLSQARSSLKKNQIEMDAVDRMHTFMADMAGIPQTNSEKLTQRMSEEVFKKMKIFGKPIAKDLVHFLTGLGYGTSMGFRPWSAIKNLGDLYQATFRLGNDWVERAIDYLGDEANKGWVDTLKKKAVLQHDGINLPGLGRMKIQTWIDGYTKKGLALFKTMDDFTRSVGYTGSSLKFESAWGRWQKKLIDYKGFVDESGLWNLKELDFKKAENFIQQGQIQTAKDFYATQLMGEMFPDYKAGSGNYSTKGVVGRLFGQMGHYSMVFTQNLLSGVTRGSVPQRIGNMARYLVNSTALYLTAEKILGVRGETFLPWSPVLFTGGPSFGLAVDMLGMGSPGYKGQQSRAEVLGIKTKDGMPYIDPASISSSALFKALVPMQARSISSAVNALNDGDAYSAFLSLTSAPVDVKRAIWGQ